MYGVGRLVDNCPHLSGWDTADGEERCRSCGTRRFTRYGALRPPGLPAALTPRPPQRDPGGPLRHHRDLTRVPPPRPLGTGRLGAQPGRLNDDSARQAAQAA
ncbi:hypothetical protein GCM10020000_19280 [Streptomyces olivoverticillatus]